MLKYILLVFFALTTPSQANDICDVLDELAGVEWTLQKFDRVEGDFRFTEKLAAVDVLDGITVDLPVFSYEQVEEISFVHGSARIYKDQAGEGVLLVFNPNYKAREQIQEIIIQEQWANYADVHIFDFVKDSLGVDKLGFCAEKDVSKTVSMYMASVVQAIPGSGQGKTQVHEVSELGALMLMKEGGPYVEFIFPDPGNINALVHVRMFSEIDVIDH